MFIASLFLISTLSFSQNFHVSDKSIKSNVCKEITVESFTVSSDDYTVYQKSKDGASVIIYEATGRQKNIKRCLVKDAFSSNGKVHLLIKDEPNSFYAYFIVSNKGSIKHELNSSSLFNVRMSKWKGDSAIILLYKKYKNTQGKIWKNKSQLVIKKLDLSENKLIEEKSIHVIDNVISGKHHSGSDNFFIFSAEHKKSFLLTPMAVSAKMEQRVFVFNEGLDLIKDIRLPIDFVNKYDGHFNGDLRVNNQKKCLEVVAGAHNSELNAYCIDLNDYNINSLGVISQKATYPLLLSVDDVSYVMYRKNKKLFLKNFNDLRGKECVVYNFEEYVNYSVFYHQILGERTNMISFSPVFRFSRLSELQQHPFVTLGMKAALSGCSK
jgi:hypothetical protein